MKIILNGVETNNKGAELMLYAILQEIEKKYPNAIVMLPNANIRQGYNYIKTSLKFEDLPNSGLIKKLNKYHLVGLLRRLKLPYLQYTEFRRVKDADYFIDGSGFTFSDQWHHKITSYKIWKYRLDYYKSNYTNIVFLPQAFGPIEENVTKDLIDLLSENASLIFAREQRSYEYLLKANVDKKKIRVCTDFTSLVEGVIPNKYRHLEGRVCLIPNLRLIDKGSISKDKYLAQLENIIANIREEGRDVFLLNHEGVEDEKLCNQIKEHVGDIEVVTGLNALEVKGVISISYLCITSRFHGLASALNSCVPSLAFGWSHKYEELFKDYAISGCMLELDNIEETKIKINWLLAPPNNQKIRDDLNKIKPKIQEQTRQMWNQIWNLGGSRIQSQRNSFI